MLKLKSYKAEAWRSAAITLEIKHNDYVLGEAGPSDPDTVAIVKHIRTVVVQALKRKAQIIERKYLSKR